MCRAEVSYSKTIPAKFPFGQRSFLKATFFDQEKRLLVSKSILRNDMPPVSATSCPFLPALQRAILRPEALTPCTAGVKGTLHCGITVLVPR